MTLATVAAIQCRTVSTFEFFRKSCDTIFASAVYFGSQYLLRRQREGEGGALWKRNPKSQITKNLTLRSRIENCKNSLRRAPPLLESVTKSPPNVLRNTYTYKNKKYVAGRYPPISLLLLVRQVLTAAAFNEPTSPQNQTKQRSTRFKYLPTLGATSLYTFFVLICLETVLLSTMSNCAKTFYMHWNTSNSIFRIDNTDHIIDVNKGNLAFEFDQVHIICPVYEPGTYENETEKYIIYNVSKVEYETCRITNADPRVIAICDKPHKLMFFTITFRPFTPQPGGLEFLPGNDYYFISTSSKDDLYRRIGGRCSTNNMKVVFKVCCATEDQNKTSKAPTSEGGNSKNANSGGGKFVPSSANDSGIGTSVNAPVENNMEIGEAVNPNQAIFHISNGNSIGYIPNGNGGVRQMKPISGVSTTINTNLDQFNRIPMQPNIIGNTNGAINGLGNLGGGGILLTPDHGLVNILPPNRVGVSIAQYPGHHHIPTGIRINNVPTQENFPSYKNNNNDEIYNKHPNEVVKNEELTYNSAANIRSAIKFGDANRLFPYLQSTYLSIVHSRWKIQIYPTLQLQSHTFGRSAPISGSIMELVFFFFNLEALYMTLAITLIHYLYKYTFCNVSLTPPDTFEISEANQINWNVARRSSKAKAINAKETEKNSMDDR